MLRSLDTLKTAHHALCLRINTAFVGEKTGRFADDVTWFRGNSATITNTLRDHYYEFYLLHRGGSTLHTNFMPEFLVIGSASHEFIGSVKNLASSVLSKHCTALLYPIMRSSADAHELSDLALQALKIQITQQGDADISTRTCNNACANIDNILDARDVLAKAKTLDAILTHYQSLDATKKSAFAAVYAKQNEGLSLDGLLSLRRDTPPSTSASDSSSDEEKKTEEHATARSSSHGVYGTLFAKSSPAVTPRATSAKAASSDDSDSDEEIEKVVTSADIAARLKI